MNEAKKRKINLFEIILIILAVVATGYLWLWTDYPWYIVIMPLLLLAAYYIGKNWREVYAWLKERIRKFLVSLKRNPQFVPMAVLLGAFVLYSLNLTHMSDSTAKIQGAGMGLSQFCIMLFSLLSMVCMLNAFPKRKKPNYPMIGLMFIMFAIMGYCVFHYQNAIMAALNRPESPIVLDKTTQYIANAYNMLGTYGILLGITAVLIVLLPVYSKWLKKINTSVEVDDNGEMGQIELND